MKIYDFDAADMLKSDVAIGVFLADAFKTNNACHVANALAAVARAKDWAIIEHQTDFIKKQLP
jgi:probable addiction module antidote protein